MTHPEPPSPAAPEPTPALPPRPIPVTAAPVMRLIGPLGTELLLPTSSTTLYIDRRRYGQRGFTDPGNLLEQPLELPRCMADTFDFTLIGAREFTMKDEDGQQVRAAEYRGRIYKRRDLPANKKLKLPEGDVKYSRGAKEGEEDLAAGASGENKGYVTLVYFRRHAPPIPEFCKPGTLQQAQAAYDADQQTRKGLRVANAS